MRRQSSGALRPLPLLWVSPPLSILSLSLGVLIWPDLRRSQVHRDHWAGALSLVAVSEHLFIYLDLMLVLLLVAVVHFLWHTYAPSTTTPSLLGKQHCLNHWFPYLIKETHALNKRKCS